MGASFSAGRTRNRTWFDINSIPHRTGRVAIVTGASCGLGYHNAKDLASKGMTVVLAGRSEPRTLAAISSIKREVPGARLEFMHVDLSSLASVRAFSKTFKARHSQLDLLINNAGGYQLPYYRTADGFEGHMGTNYFGHFLLTSLLIDLFPNNSESRIVSLSSRAARRGLRRVKFEDINWETGYNRGLAYNHSKLACLMFALELQRRLERSGKKVISVAAHPGISLTGGILRNIIPQPVVALLRRTVVPLILSSPDVASRCTLMAALDPNVNGGQYFGPQGWRQIAGPPGPAIVDDFALDEDAGRRLWDLSVELTGAERWRKW